MSEVKANNTLKVGKYTFNSRLLIGTGKYKDFKQTREALELSGAEVITVAVRRIELTRKEGEEFIFDYVDPKRWTILPNTAGCYNVDDAVRTAQLAREALDTDLIKLEVIGDAKTLYPDNEGLLEAAKILVDDGFTVMPYCLDDPILARKLEDVGCAAVMPLAAPIGSGLGLRNPFNIMNILEAANVPIIVDAGVGTASDATRAMELGVDGILMNTAIAGAKDPLKMAIAMKDAVNAGRLAFEAGRIPKKLYATASSPVEGMIE